MTTRRELANLLSTASHDEAQALRPTLSAAFESAGIARAEGGPELIEALCIVDDPQFELDLLGRALADDPSSELLLGAYLTTCFRSGQVVVDRGDALGSLSRTEGEAGVMLRTWDAVLRHLRGLPLPAKQESRFAEALAEAHRALETGAQVQVRIALP